MNTLSYNFHTKISTLSPKHIISGFINQPFSRELRVYAWKVDKARLLESSTTKWTLVYKKWKKNFFAQIFFSRTARGRVAVNTTQTYCLENVLLVFSFFRHFHISNTSPKEGNMLISENLEKFLPLYTPRNLAYDGSYLAVCCTHQPALYTYSNVYCGITLFVWFLL